MRSIDGWRIIAGFLALAVLVPALYISGCSRKSAVSQKVTENMPWFNIKSIEVPEDFNEDAYRFCEYGLLGVKDDKIFVKVYAVRFSDKNVLQQDSEEFHLLAYDMNGNVISSNRVEELLEDAFPLASGMRRYIRVVNYDGEYINIAFDDDDDDYNAEYHTVKYDTSDGTIIETTNDGAIPIDDTYAKYCVIDGCIVKTEHQLGAEGSYISITVTDREGQQKTIDMSEEFPNFNLVHCEIIFKKEDDKALIGLTSGGIKIHYFELDLINKTITEVREGNEFVESARFYGGRYVEGVGNVVTSGKGIDVIDIKEQKINNYFDINNCNLNRSLCSFIDVNDVSSGRIVLSSMASISSDRMVKSNLHIFILNKCDTNPHVGKDIIKIASFGDLSYAMAEGICRFNDSSETHLIVVDERYDIRRHEAQSIGTQTESTDAYYDQLIADIQNGNGPDMIFNLSGVEQLYSDEYLLDLSDLELPADVITGVFDALKTPEGKLYHIPLSFAPTGLVTHKDKIPDGTTGLSFDEYGKLVSDACNGDDPLGYDQTAFLDICMKYYSRDLDLDSEAFAELAEYAKNDFYTSLEYEPEESAVIVDRIEYRDMFFDPGLNISYFLDQCNGDINAYSLVGLPSSDRIGPRFFVGESIAVTSGSSNIDACKEVIRCLLSNEIQNLYDINDPNPVTENALEQYISKEVIFYNDQVDRYLTYYAEEQVADKGYRTDHLEINETVEAYKTIVGSCSGLYSIDPVVERIIIEEMQAYFAGQKDLDQVITIIKDRIKTYQNERS